MDDLQGNVDMVPQTAIDCKRIQRTECQGAEGRKPALLTFSPG